jgi:hypothetical protein
MLAFTFKNYSIPHQTVAGHFLPCHNRENARIILNGYSKAWINGRQFVSHPASVWLDPWPSGHKTITHTGNEIVQIANSRQSFRGAIDLKFDINIFPEWPSPSHRF